MSDPFIISGEGTLYPRGREYWTSPEMIRDGRPRWQMEDVARDFFAKTPVWLRMRLFRGFGTRDDFGPIEIPRTDGGARTWALHDVERMARAFLMERAIALDGYTRTINAVKAAAYLWNFDIGDYDPMVTRWAYHVEPLREQALQEVVERLQHEDASAPMEAVDPQSVEEHLITRAAWSLRALEDYYRGVKA